MKKLIFFSLLSFLAPKFGMAQYTIDTDTLHITYAAGLDEFSGYAHIKSDSTGDFSPTWNFTNLSLIPSAWVLGFCDNAGCINITSSTHSNTFLLRADSTVELSVHIAPHGASLTSVIPVGFNGGGKRSTLYLAVDINATSIQELAAQSMALQVFPNPVSDKTTCSFNMTSSMPVEVQVIDMYGNVVSQSKVEASQIGLNQWEVNTSTLAAGVYSVRLIAADKIFQKQFIKY